MGLDISYARGAERVEGVADADAAYEQSLEWIYPNPNFKDRADDLVEGAYRVEEREHFRAGAYSYYNRWRAWLCLLALDCTPDRVWNDPKTFEGTPFVELVNFSDCEGVIGPKTSAKLAKDFIDFTDRAESAPGEEGFVELYAEFRRAFVNASDRGFVDFH